MVRFRVSCFAMRSTAACLQLVSDAPATPGHDSGERVKEREKEKERERERERKRERERERERG